MSGDRLSSRIAAAALRAEHSLPSGDVDLAGLTALLRSAGRRLVEAQVAGDRQLTAGWTDETRPVIDQETIIGPVATRSVAIAFASALGLCWPDPSAPPYPGLTVELSQVLDAAGRVGLDHAWAKGSLTNVLCAAAFVEIDGNRLRLGPSVAAFTPGQLSALRRIHDRFPASGEADGQVGR